MLTCMVPLTLERRGGRTSGLREPVGTAETMRRGFFFPPTARETERERGGGGGGRRVSERGI